jgi:hypothetical protein
MGGNLGGNTTIWILIPMSKYMLCWEIFCGCKDKIGNELAEAGFFSPAGHFGFLAFLFASRKSILMKIQVLGHRFWLD